MHIVAIAWMFVVVLMTAAEATSSQGSLLGAFFTLLLYGLMPLAIVLYILGTPGRKAARRRAEAAADEASGPTGNAGGHAAGDAGQTVRKEP
jgi:membrane protein implicated in regulation of membrane protease activity